MAIKAKKQQPCRALCGNQIYPGMWIENGPKGWQHVRCESPDALSAARAAPGVDSAEVDYTIPAPACVYCGRSMPRWRAPGWSVEAPLSTAMSYVCRHCSEADSGSTETGVDKAVRSTGATEVAEIAEKMNELLDAALDRADPAANDLGWWTNEDHMPDVQVSSTDFLTLLAESEWSGHLYVEWIAGWPYDPSGAEPPPGVNRQRIVITRIIAFDGELLEFEGDLIARDGEPVAPWEQEEVWLGLPIELILTIEYRRQAEGDVD